MDQFWIKDKIVLCVNATLKVVVVWAFAKNKQNINFRMSSSKCKYTNVSKLVK